MPTKPLELKQLYLVHGDDKESIIARIDALIKAFAKTHGACNVERYDADDVPIEEAANLVGGIGSLLGNRLVVFAHADAWSKEKPDKVAALVDAVSKAPEETTIVFVMQDIPKRNQHWKALREIARKNGKELEYKLPTKPWDVEDWAWQRAKEFRLDITPHAMKLLIEMCSRDCASIVNEIRKLAIYAGGSKTPVSTDDVEELVMKRTRYAEHALMSAIADGDHSRALAELSSSFDAGVGSNVLASSLSNEIRRIAAAKHALRTKRGPQAVAGEVQRLALYQNGCMPEWMAERLIARAKEYGQERIAAAMIACDAELDVDTPDKASDALACTRCVVKMSSSAS